MNAPTPSGRRRLLGRVLAAALLALLTVSLGLNVVLYRFSRQTYEELHRVRLDPTASGDFVGYRRTIPPLPAGQQRLVFFGDSRIQMWRDLPQPANCQSVNSGVGQQTTAQLLQRIDRDVLALQPRAVVLQAGVNDLKTIGLFPDKADQITADCAHNLDAIIQRLRERDIHVVVLTIFPAGSVPAAQRLIWSERTREAIAQVNDHLRRLQMTGVTVIDCDPLFAQGGHMKGDYALDALHLNDAGYAALRMLVEPRLAEAMGR